MNRCLVALLCWSVLATPIRVIDGDTFTATMPVWFQLHATETIRVLGVNTPEMKGATLEAAKASKAFTEKWVFAGPINLVACMRDSFGRVLGHPTRNGESLAESLIAAGHGVKR